MRRGASVAALALWATASAATQPAADGFALVRQAPAECAATTTWLMLNHYAGGEIETLDPRRREYANRALPEVCLGQRRRDCRDAEPTGRAALSAEWIALQRGSRRSPSLRYLAERLQQMRAPGGGERLFVVAGDFSAAGRGAAPERRQRLRTIRGHLDAGRPVMLHLGRPSLVPGHYIVLVGYRETEQGRRYLFADTAQAEALREVSEAELAGRDAWYRASDYPLVNARWNGRYLTFWPAS